MRPAALAPIVTQKSDQFGTPMFCESAWQFSSGTDQVVRYISVTCPESRTVMIREAIAWNIIAKSAFTGRGL